MANAQKIRATVTEIRDYGNHVYGVWMRLEKRMPRFKAGQFLHLSLDSFDPTIGYWPESRVFSIASCSSDRTDIMIVFSVKGVYTKKMEDSLRVGDEIWLKGPYGDFIIANHTHDAKQVVLIAGGTGLSPFIPFLAGLPDTIDVDLHYGIRHIDLMIFDQELNQALQHPRFKLHFYVEQEIEDSPFQGKATVKHGMLSIPEILGTCANVVSTKFFLSGPPGMIRLFRDQLIHADIPESNIIIDEWS